MPLFLTTASSVMCPHGGQAILSTSNVDAKVQGMPILLVTDVHSVSGCPFQVPAGPGAKPQPCLTIRWTTGTVLARHRGATPFLHQSSTGICYSAEQIPQGAPLITQTQPLANGQ